MKLDIENKTKLWLFFGNTKQTEGKCALCYQQFI